MKQIQTISVIIFLLCVNVLAQKDISSSELFTTESFKNGQVIYQNRPNGVNAAPYYLDLESFETFLPTGWLNWTPTAGSWQQTSPRSYTGTNSAFADAVPNSESWLVTPAINLNGAIDPVLIFYSYFDDTFSNEYNDERIIKISTDYTNNGDPSSATWIDFPFDVYDFQIWYRKQILLSDYSNQIIYLAFVYKGSSNLHGVDWYLDDVSVEEKSIEDFEDELNFPPIGWSSNGSGWEQAFNGYNSNLSAYAYFDPYDGPTQIDRWLITPQIDLTTATTPGLKYYEMVYPAEGGIGAHYVLISTNGGGSWSSIRNIISNLQDWNVVEVDLTPYAGNNNVQIAFYYNFDSQGEEIFGSEWYIDDVSITDDGGCTGLEPIPDYATLTSPPNGASSLHRFVSFFWDPPFEDVTKQFFYAGTDGEGNTTPTNLYNGLEFESNTIGIGPVELLTNTTYYWQVIPANSCETAVNCPIWSFTTNDGELNYGGGGTTQGGYYFANSTAGASGSPSQPIYNWIDISGTGTNLINSITGDETVGPFSLGFTFNYFGIDYTQFYISANGFVSFSDATGYTSFPEAIPSTRNPDNLIAGYWKDLDPTNPNVLNKRLYYGLNGGDMVITFENFPQAGGDAEGWISFQIILKPSGNIKIQYQNTGATFDLNGGTVGIENSDGTAGILYRHRSFGGPISGAPLAVEFGSNGSALPVELSSFSAAVIGQNVKINWTTETEVNNYGFEVERMSDVKGQTPSSWKKLGFVNGNGNSNSPKNYSFNDKDVKGGKYSYRLKQIDNDGQFEFSKTIEVDINLPLEFSLNQNYPNPFNPTTTIKYSIPNVTLSGVEGSRVQLKIYDVLGNEVATLVNENKPAGSYEVNFDAEGLTSGIYFYKLQAGSFVQTKKMILIK